jgi:hypothetical protein
VVVKDVLVRSNISTRRGLEANRELPASSVSINTWDFIRDLDGFKPHRVVSWGCLVLLENLLIHGGKEI